mmetsp:Transcript_6852/g.9620  ORF Transcript_6852/g.9620 Transcript_6852/m.9620 type:complete len:448 (-) Transcript_6852:280-1623(-)|eukprot:CAMPEP_0171471818 /NCGR_PEP_ID=MMETSP0946-20130122/928_1 /TAXON_ID=109269 /ORGANISM="Vaucheria litorea, Strain CCMP2940" /LENGTH=447 /DNA_ID=CAMNT_0012001375 /DNA_START=66 /DNA_END=1409 /DNA_ORIENTATION=-
MINNSEVNFDFMRQSGRLQNVRPHAVSNVSSVFKLEPPVQSEFSPATDEEEYFTEEACESFSDGGSTGQKKSFKIDMKPFLECSSESLMNSNPPAKSQGPRKWCPDEDERLRRAVEKRGESHWKSIAAEVRTRNHVQCLQRWKKVLRPGLRKGSWTKEEDELLTILVGHGFKNWGVLASNMNGRTSKQCRERWEHHLDPEIKRTPYTQEEDLAILLGHSRLGNRWSKIAVSLPGRTENSIKARFNQLQRERRSISPSSSCSSPEAPSLKFDSSLMNQMYKATNSYKVNVPNQGGIRVSNNNTPLMHRQYQRGASTPKSVLWQPRAQPAENISQGMGLCSINPSNASYNSNQINSNFDFGWYSTDFDSSPFSFQSLLDIPSNGGGVGCSGLSEGKSFPLQDDMNLLNSDYMYSNIIPGSMDDTEIKLAMSLAIPDEDHDTFNDIWNRI